MTSHRENKPFCAKCGGECLYDDNGKLKKMPYMKITNQENSGQTTYHNIDAELKDGAKVSAVLTVMEDFNTGSSSDDLTIVESDRELTENEINDLKELAYANLLD